MDVVTQTRGKNVSTIGAVVQTVLTLVMLILWLWTHSMTAMVCTVALAGGILLWLMVAVLFYCRKLERLEALELEEIALRANAGTIFERTGQELRPAANRLRWIERWALPIFTLLFATYHAALGVMLARYIWNHSPVDVESPVQGLLFAVLLAFVGFLFSRYATGMGTRPEYRPLRAVGSYLLMNVLLLAGAVVAMALATNTGTEVDPADRWIALIGPVLMVVLAVELTLNLLMDIYRPRLAGQEQRLAFDSRLLNLVADPSRVGHSIAETLNYQFGFEVSKTWFYQLLGRAFVPLLIFGALVLWGMTAIVVVNEGEKAVLLHAGARAGVLEPGIHVKYPWPIDRADRFDVRKVREIMVGAGEKRSEMERRATIVNGKELLLWSQEHGVYRERDFLLAAPARQNGAASQPSDGAPVDVAKQVTTVQYVVTDPVKFGYTYANAERTLEEVANREVFEFFAGHTLTDLMRGTAPADELRARLVEAVGPRGLDIGVEIRSVGFSALHPPVDAAKAYDEVLQAERNRDEQRFAAQAEANKLLANVGGRPALAVRLAVALQSLNDLTGLSYKPDAQFKAAVETAAARLRIEAQILREQAQRRNGLFDADAGAIADATIDDMQAELALLTKATGGKPGDLAPAIAVAKAKAEALFGEIAQGDPAVQVAQAKQDRWRRDMERRGEVDAAARQMAAYEASPRLYMMDRWLDVWDEMLPNMKKTVLGVDREKLHLWFDMRNQSSPMQGIYGGSEKK